MQQKSEIAKNTLLLYIRTFVTMCISLYTSRIVLKQLGITDFGIYNVVGGFVTMFSLITSSLSASTSRFFAFALGEGDEKKLQSFFSTSVRIHRTIALLIVVIAESIGLIFLDKLNIPLARMNAAHWVYHIIVGSFAIKTISIPYTATIIAHEKMKIFAYISIIEAILNLTSAIALTIISYDKLIAYSIFIACISILTVIIYRTYCKTSFLECKYNRSTSTSSLKEMTHFAGWNLLGSSAYLFNTEGVNIVSNLFFGVTTNAARGIANQVEGAIKQFVFSFTTAINPQITKSYASDHLEFMHDLICQGAKFSYLLMLFFVVPLLFEADTVLYLWLKNYPPEAPLFLRLTLIGTMLDMLGNSTANAAWATGNIKRYYLIIGGVGSLVFPISWICFASGCDAYFSYIVFATIYAIIMLLKVYIIKDLVKFPVKRFFSEVLAKIAPVTICSAILPLIIFITMNSWGMVRFFFIIITSEFSVLTFTFLIGLTRKERDYILNTCKEKLAHVFA